MRSLYQASPWIAANAFNGRPSTLATRSSVSRLGAPSTFFTPAPFIPRPVMRGCIREEEIGKSETTHQECACKLLNLGQGCAKPTAGGSGGAEYGVGAGAAGDNTVVTLALVGGVGIAALLLLGVI